MRTKPLLCLFAVVMFLAACKKDNSDPVGQWTNSIFITNEGPFPVGSGSVSAYDRTSGEVLHDVFEDANGLPLGNIVQSMSIHQDHAYIIVNNANKIEVVNLSDFKSVYTIENLGLPRYFLGIGNDKAYVSCWDGTLKSINLADFSIKATLPAGEGPDEMVYSGGKLFVINSGAFGVDSTVTVIDTEKDEVVTNLIVGHRPSGIVKDMNSNIWVLCSGKGWNGFPSDDDTPAKLVCLDPLTMEFKKTLVFPDTENHPDNLIVSGNGQILYYNHPAGIFFFDINAEALNMEPFITENLFSGNSMFYALGFDPEENIIYGSDPMDYAQSGWVYRYHAGDGSPAGSFLAGWIPGGFCFNE